MSDLHGRAFLPFEGNATDALIGGKHFNRTILEQFGYQLYSNGTLSNGSSCILTEPPHTPVALWTNGTFVNTTYCFEPYHPVGPRAKAAMGFACLYGLALVLCLVALNKHGRLYLPVEKRFWPIGRRWQWYWGILVCATAFISLIAQIDVDRYFLPQLPVLLAAFFWYVMQLGAVALVWEAVRHWGSWLERQFIDPDPFALPQDDRRARFEFWLPLWFYLWFWLNFFFVIPRNWEPLELQRSPEQSANIAEPSATDIRMKVGALCLIVCWMTLFVSIRHSIKHYKPRNRGLVNRTLGILRFTPWRFTLLLPLVAALIAYQALCAWTFRWSVLNIAADIGPSFVGAYVPTILILFVQLAAAYRDPNEDKDLIRQRRVRGAAADVEIGITRKPAWWRLARADPERPEEGMRDRIVRNVRGLGGGQPTTTRNLERIAAARAPPPEAVEMGPLSAPAGDAAARPPPPYAGKSDARRSERALQGAAGVLFPNAQQLFDRRLELMQDGPPPPSYGERGRGREVRGPDGPAALRPRAAAGERSTSTGGTSVSGVTIGAPPQTVRSMLDV